MACSFFQVTFMEEAWPIFDKHDYKPGLAEIYYRFGKRNERNDDISETMFTADDKKDTFAYESNMPNT